VAQQPAIAGTTIVLMSSSADVSPTEAAEASIAVVLTKPVLLSRLRDTLARLLAERPERRTKTSRDAPSARSKGRVLVVDDGEVNRLVAVGILNHLGFSTVAVDDGRQALGALADGTFDAVLMDVQMPGLDGYQTTAELRRREEQDRHTPVIAMTATVTDGERERCLAAGMDDYLAKPITPSSVSVVLERWMALREAQSS
jgi:two-component system, sensor histidine kinase and response regulator